MLLTRTITKKILENIVHETFSKFGSFSCSSLLDSLKFLGFYYATNAGISINIEDLKTPDVKKKFLEQAENEVEFISKNWELGSVSETERFQKIIDTWNFATESLKNRIVDYYQHYDPANNLYIMAFSGARGNMSQVRQLVGMRGLMSDQEGKIIDIPIQANFREGLSLIDYIISSYGARKGIVDTALKTADSGYLTRRLIYLTQEVVIREVDCKTNKGIVFKINNKTKGKNIIGRSFVSLKSQKLNVDFEEIAISSKSTFNFLTKKDIHSIRKFAPAQLKVRSALTCSTYGSVCQTCYGSDLAQEKIISLGEAVGVIAAQSIGEPGTQLTMRTFHTGGIFTSESLIQIVAPFSGKLTIPDSLNIVRYRTNHGTIVSKLQQEASLSFTNWQGKKKDIFLPIGSFIYITGSNFLKQNQLIAEYAKQSTISGLRRLKPIYSRFDGEVKFQNLAVLTMFRKKRTIKLIQDDGIMWIGSGKICSIPKEANFLFPKRLTNTKSFAQLKLISPYSGILVLEKSKIYILNKDQKTCLDFSKLSNNLINCHSEFSLKARNYQYVDKHTIIANLNIFSNEHGKIYSTRMRIASQFSAFFFITESDIWKIYSDQVNMFPFFNKTEKQARANNLFSINTSFSKNGYLIKKDGFEMIFQKADPIFLRAGTISYYNQGEFILKRNLIATLVNYTQQTEDIVQGLPKIEELIEARKPKRKAYLTPKPGLLLDSSFSFKLAKFIKTSLDFSNQIDSYKKKSNISKFQLFESNKNTKNSLNQKENQNERTKKDLNSQLIQILHSLDYKEKNEICLFKDYVVKVKSIIPCFSPVSIKQKIKTNKKKNKKRFYFSRKYEKQEKEKEVILFKQYESQKDYLDFLNPYSKESAEGKYRDNRLSLNQLVIKNINTARKWRRFNNKSEKVKDGKNKLFSDFETIYKVKNNQKNILTKVLTNKVYQNTKFRNVFLFQTLQKNYLLVEFYHPGTFYSFPLELAFSPKFGQYLDLGESFTDGAIDIHELLNIFAKYHCNLDGSLNGTIKSLNKFQLIMINSIQAIYQSQGVNIAGKHLEIIIRQMTSKVVIKKSGDSPFVPGELVRLALVIEISKAFHQTNANFSEPIYEPFLLSTTTSSLTKEGFLAAAGFQETKRVLTKAAIEGKVDWLRGLKECVIVGKLIPAGSAFLNYKNYLDYLFKFKRLK